MNSQHIKPLLIGAGVFIVLIAAGYLATKPADTTNNPLTKNEQANNTADQQELPSNQVQPEVSHSADQMNDAKMMKEDDMMDEDKKMKTTKNVKEGQVLPDTPVASEVAIKEEVEPAAETIPTEPQPSTKAAGVYTAYSAAAVQNSNAENIVLFFHASWCPSCRNLDKNINANTASIPSGTEIYKLDYDTATALKQKYGVTTQHTLVEVTANGTLVQKWTGSRDLSAVIQKL